MTTEYVVSDKVGNLKLVAIPSGAVHRERAFWREHLERGEDAEVVRGAARGTCRGGGARKHGRGGAVSRRPCGAREDLQALHEEACLCSS